MTRQLVESVYVAGRFFAAGDVLDEETAALITNPKVWDDYVPERTPARRSAPAAPAAADPNPDTGAGPAAGDPADPGGELFDPATGGLDDVNNHLANADADEIRRVLALEAAGKQRKGILEGPYAPDEA